MEDIRPSQTNKVQGNGPSNSGNGAGHFAWKKATWAMRKVAQAMGQATATS